MGARIAEWMSSHATIPVDYWKRIATEVFQLSYTVAVTTRLRRAYREWRVKTCSGAFTDTSAGGDRRGTIRRAASTTFSQSPAATLSFELYQWFMDEVVSLRCRADSTLVKNQGTMLLRELLEAGVDPKELPNEINKKYLLNWRRLHGVSIRDSTTQYKVSRAKMEDRVATMLGNIFRLRRLWALSFPGEPMRWASLDQKPSWFNNAGHRPTYAPKGSKGVTTKEDFAGTRQRYTIMTWVLSWTSEICPPVCVLFKAKSGKRILSDLRSPPWMMVQTQEKGSYRACNMVDSLLWGLPDATNPSESIVVMLDWFSAHLTPDVVAAIRAKGHIVIYHGGGATGVEQVNDTHLHALVQRVMEELETLEQFEQRKRYPSKVPKLSRQKIIELVGQMWLRMDHKDVAKKGYTQTGPTLPDDVGAAGVFRDLKPFWEAVDGDKIRAEAYDLVQDLWDTGAITGWADAATLIEDHTPHPLIEEGAEGADIEIVDDDAINEDAPDSEADIDEDDDPNGGGDDDDGPGGG